MKQSIMLVLALFLFCCCTTAFPTLEFYEWRQTHFPPRHHVPPATLKAQYFDNRIDHFSAYNLRTYKQRYFVNDTFWVQHPKSPIFLYIGGEGSESAQDAFSGHHMKMAKEHSALVIVLEHRFYGTSVPKGGLTLDNLQYLSSQQALADIAQFKHFICEQWNLQPETPWISFGGSYPGALSAWLRQKYPSVVYAAVASSAPVRAVLDFVGYNEVVAKSLSTESVGGSPKCLSNVKKAFKQLGKVLQQPNDSSKQEKLKTIANWCNPSSDPLDVATFVQSLAGFFEGGVQYNQNHGMIESLCDYMNVPESQLLSTLGRIGLDDQDTCRSASYAEQVNQLKQTDGDAVGVGVRQWIYQTCTQFGYYQTCDSPECPFLPQDSLTSFTQLCQDVFNVDLFQVQKSVQFSNEYYGGNTTSGTRTLFVNGLIDEWHVLSVQHDLSQIDDVHAVLIPGASHCQDMMMPDTDDPESLVQGRLSIEQKVRTWVAQAYSEVSRVDIT